MTIEYIRYEMPDGELQEKLRASYIEAGKSLQASAHCLGYELTQCEEDATCFVLRIQWDSTEGHLEGFRRSPEFREFYRAIAPYVSNIKEMRHYGLTNVEWRRS
ncbi:MAG: antibiotic biosynthesis monooxygenase family protein [Bryobacteraceae bacterium]